MLEPQDFRDVLAVARARSLKAAAATIGVDASTMGRRIDGIESRFGARLFVRTAAGLTVTPEGAHVMTAAEKLEDVQHAFERELVARSAGQRHALSLTVAEWGIPLITPLLAQVAQQHPDTQLRLRIDSRSLDLARREADLALRVGGPSEPSLVGRRAGVIEYGLYGSTDYLRRHPAPKQLDDCERHVFATLDHTFARAPHVVWQASLARTARIAFETNSMLSLVEAARAGIGLATLPRVLGDRVPELRRVLPQLASVERDLWLVFHRDLRKSSSVRRLVDTLLEKIKPLFLRA